MRRTWLLGLCLLSMAAATMARTLYPRGSGDRTRSRTYEIDREQLYRCHGMDEETCEIRRELMAELRYRMAIATGQPVEEIPREGYEEKNTCIIFTVDQLEDILDNLDLVMNNSSTPQRRKKRGVLNFKQQPYFKWTMPVPYKFFGDHSEGERIIIRNAAQHWMDNTCVRFTEIPWNQNPSYKHILITNYNAGCSSYVGKVNFQTPYQQLNLHDNCLYNFGIPVHEFGHALGLIHAQMRQDRDDWITILWKNIGLNAESQFMAGAYNTDPLGVPYDYGSVMHYSPMLANRDGMDTMVAKNPLYQMNMGQRTGLSFNDIRLINRAYCSDSCSGRSIAQPCQNGGYQDPNDCSRCLCPDGLGGNFCEKVAPARNAQCGGEIVLREESDRMTIMSPGYNYPGYYSPFQECSWWFKAPRGYNLQLQFDGPFALYCQSQACFHWVEIKYKADISLEGARFCCYHLPSVMVTSESNEMLVVFKSNFTYNYNSAMRGFKAHITLVKDSSNTTPAPVAPVPSVAPVPILWQCSFEPEAGNQFCGMIQDPTDDFDWTINKGPTPSDPTGPDSASDKDYYIFIEASSPRKPNDQAKLLLPDFSKIKGDACLSFSYHMFGFHINALKVLQVGGATTDIKELWARKGQIDNMWHQASISIQLEANKQLQFVGVRGNEFSGDIALDNIQLTSGKCS